jgi:hypothetical protein
MNPARLLRLTGTLVHLGAEDDRDEYNNIVRAETTSTVSCWVEQTQRSEDTVDTDQQAETYRIFLPAGTTAAGSDRLTVAGATYEFIGPPWSAVNPRTTTTSHIEATGRRVT